MSHLLVDFTRAFDTVDHVLVVHKFDDIVFQEILLNWLFLIYLIDFNS
jgi:hypothetical protein